MTQLSRDDIHRLAQLSALQLTDDEITSLTLELSHILDYVGQLDELDTDNVEPSYQVAGLENVWRYDEVQPGVAREHLLALAPQTLDDQIKVPKVL